MTSLLTADAITKVFPNGARALDGVSFDARGGRVLTLLGPSGCGKSTLLRIVAGLERATSGSLTLDGRPLDGVPPGERDVGFVFQSYALYPHLDVARNLSLALETRRLPRAEIDARVTETARLLGLETLLDRKPRELSGGQQQRVAVGRALVRRPSLYLMDEPLSNLDALLREGMRAELKLLFRRFEATVLYVTHDQAEAMSLSDEVLVLKDGRVRQLAAPLELYARPADLFVATFVGSPRMTTWSGARDGETFVGRGVTLPIGPGVASDGGELVAGFRPEDVEVSESPLADGFEARLEFAEPTGDRMLLTLRAGEESLRALVPARAYPERLHARPAAARLHFFSVRNEKRLV